MKHKTFATWLQSVRTEQGVPQAKVCKDLKISKPTYSRWERGQGLPHADRLLGISKWGDIEADKLLQILAA